MSEGIYRIISVGIFEENLKKNLKEISKKILNFFFMDLLKKFPKETFKILFGNSWSNFQWNLWAIPEGISQKDPLSNLEKNSWKDF